MVSICVDNGSPCVCVCVCVQAGVVRVRCSSGGPWLFTGCLDGCVRMWDVRGGECVRAWQGHTKDLLDLTLSRYIMSDFSPPIPSLPSPLCSDDRLILSGSDDKTALVFSNDPKTL